MKPEFSTILSSKSHREDLSFTSKSINNAVNDKKKLLMLVEVSDPSLFEEVKGESMGKGEKEGIPQCLCMTSRNTPSFPGDVLICWVPV